MEETIMIVKKLEDGRASVDVVGTGEDELLAVRYAVIAVLNSMVKRRGIAKIPAALLIAEVVRNAATNWLRKN